LSPEVVQYYKQYNPTYSALPRLESSCIEYNDDAQQLVFIYPQENSTLFLPDNLEGEREKCILKARHKYSNSKIYWHINNRFYTITEDIHEVALDLDYGDYIVTIQDEEGMKQSRSIRVISGD
jgi:penicillin-binding protein 1C